jgi:hypothetical protein
MRRAAECSLGPVEDVLVQSVVDRADHERPRESRPAATLRLDHVAKPGRGHVPAVPACETVRSGDAIATRPAALVFEELMAEKPDSVRTKLRPDPVWPHSPRVVDEFSHFLGGRRELALVNVSDYQRLSAPLVARRRIPMRISCTVASNVATAKRMNPVQ